MVRVVVVYCRQSVAEHDQTLSLDSQATACRAHAAAQGWAVAGEYRDADVRGWREADRRPGLAAALADIRGGLADGLLVWKLDRLARKLRIQEHVIDDIADLGAAVVSVTEPWVAQPLFRQLLGAVAEQQTRDQRAHTVRALGERRARGLHVGSVAYAYRSAGPDRPPVPDRERPDRIAAVRRAFDLRAAGASAYGIARDLSANGYRTASGSTRWNTATIFKLLRNPIYRGAFNYGAFAGHPEPLEGAVEPIVDPDLWHRAQAIPNRVRAPRRKSSGSWLEGRIDHACGQPMYLIGAGATARKGKDYFECRTNRGRYPGEPTCRVLPGSINADKAEAAVWRQAAAALARAVDAETAVARARARVLAGDPAAAERRAALEADRDAAALRRTRARELYLDGLLDRAGLDAAVAEADRREAAARAGLARLPAVPDLAVARATAARLRALAGAFDAIRPEDRAGVLAELGRVVLAPGGPRLVLDPALAAYVGDDPSSS